MAVIWGLREGIWMGMGEWNWGVGRLDRGVMKGGNGVG